MYKAGGGDFLLASSADNDGLLWCTSGLTNMTKNLTRDFLFHPTASNWLEWWWNLMHEGF
jgi:hypothetical protein